MYFNKAQLTSLDQIQSGAKIHVIGVCGVAMAQIAVELSHLGFKVSGSDKEFYEPMASVLTSSSIECRKTYSAANICDDLALVVIGNSVVKDNPEVQEAERLALPYAIFPQLLYDLIIKNRRSLVVSGTHGKTTTSAMLSYALIQLGLEPSYFFGGKAIQIESGLKLGQGRFSVVEGDEYDSAFFAKLAKFHFYKPNTLIVNSVEFDHADIYRDIEQIFQEFLGLIQDMPPNSNIVGSFDDKGVRDIFKRIHRQDLNLISYGEDPNSKIRIEFSKDQGRNTTVVFKDLSDREVSLNLSIPGRFNLKNAIACYLALECEGIYQIEKLPEIFKSFRGVARRQQVWLEEPVKLIEDFAHHPTAVAETLKALKEWNPNKRIIAVFEPRSVTSRKKIFESDYIDALAHADIVILKEVEARPLDNLEDLIQVHRICKGLIERGGQAFYFKDNQMILDCVLAQAIPENVVVVMSNGSFGGLITQLESALK
jgi:UDP-N-acetylmuramate: L-alanyl-gamma-D-glutamyl-meso-diaminopimelate ligase